MPTPQTRQKFATTKFVLRFCRDNSSFCSCLLTSLSSLLKKKRQRNYIFEINYIIHVYDDLEIDFQKKTYSNQEVLLSVEFRFNALQTLNCV